jgi:hypothetical protein
MNKYLLVRSKDRQAHSANSANFQINLTKPYQNVNRVQLLSCNINNTCYNVTNDNHFIYLSEGGGATLTATLTNGSYDIIQLVNHLKVVLDLAGALTYTVSSTGITQKITIAATGNFALLFSTVGQINELIGFTQANTTSAATHTGTNVYNLDYPREIFIDVAELSNNVQSTNIYGDSHTFVVPVGSTSSYAIQFGEYSDYNIFCPNNPLKQINSLTITLREQNSKTLDLNGSEWEMLLKFTTE